MNWWAVALVVVVVVVFAARYARRGIPRKLDGLVRPISDLLKRGYSDGFLVISRSSDGPFLQLRKYIKAPESIGIELLFPRLEWSEKYETLLFSYCEEHEYEYKFIKEGNGRVVEFICIDFGMEVICAHEFVKGVILEVFGWPENVTCYVRLENAHPSDVLVDR